MIRVGVVDDHVAFREAFVTALGQEPDFQIVGQASSEAAARPWIKDSDVVLLGMSLEDGTSIKLIREFHSLNPAGIVIVMAPHLERGEIAMAVEAGAIGALPASCPFQEVVSTLRRAHAGVSLISPQETIDLLRLAAERRESEFAAIQALNRLTPREIEVLQILAEGIGDREIAERLNISTETVRTHFVNILSKLGVNSRIQALVFAVRHGLAGIPKE